MKPKQESREVKDMGRSPFRLVVLGDRVSTNRFCLSDRVMSAYVRSKVSDTNVTFVCYE